MTCFAGNTMMVAHVVDKDGDRLPGIEFLLPGEHIPTAAEEVATDGNLPVVAELVGNFLNPFNPATHIRFNLAASGRREWRSTMSPASGCESWSPDY